MATLPTRPPPLVTATLEHFHFTPARPSPNTPIAATNPTGHEPATKFLAGQLKLDEAGYVVTAPDSTATSIEGVFAAGDVQVGGGGGLGHQGL